MGSQTISPTDANCFTFAYTGAFTEGSIPSGATSLVTQIGGNSASTSDIFTWDDTNKRIQLADSSGVTTGLTAATYPFTLTLTESNTSGPITA